MKKYLSHLPLISLLFLIVCSSCSSHETKKVNLKIAALLKSSTNPFFNLMWEGIKSEADKLGLEVHLFWPDSESDFEYQYNFLKSQAYKYNALIISPSNPDGVAPYLP